MTKLDSILKSRDIIARKGPSSQSCGFSSSNVWMWELDYKESWVLKNWCFWTVVLNEKILESPLDYKEIQPVHPKGNKSWIFIGRTDAEAPIFRSHDAKSWLIRKDLDAGKDWRQEEKGMTEWNGLMALPTWWTWVWASSGSWWRTVKPGVLQSMRMQRVRYNWATEPYVYISAATAKSLQSCPILCDPIDGSPPGSPVPGILQARTLEWVAISFSSA